MIPIFKATTRTITFYMVDSAGDAVTSITPTVQFSKNGGSWATATNSPSEVANGLYKIVTTTTETNTEGDFNIRATGTGAVEWRDSRYIIDPDTYKAVVTSLATSAEITALNDLSASDVNAQVDQALLDYDGPTKTEMDSSFAALNDLSTADVNAQVDSALADYDPPTDSEMDSQFSGLGATLSSILSAISGLNDLSEAEVNAQVDAAFTTQMADSVPADGSIPTREQAIYMIVQFLMERVVSGTTVSVKKVDGSTDLLTLSTNSATAPTTISRAT